MSALAAALLGATVALTPVTDTYDWTLIGKAQADECFAGVGVPYPPGPPCATGQPKVNQAYVWGLTKVGKQVWFGTGANTHCITTGTALGDTTAVLNADYVCEYAQSQVPLVPPAFGDVRPPQVWMHDTATGALTNRSGDVLAASDADARRLRSTIGLRSAGNAKGIVLFAGPSLTSTLNVFAFDAVTQRFLGSRTLAQYGNARTFLNAQDELYLGVGIGPDGGRGGAVLRWTGNRITPLQFDRVATLPAQAADLAYQDGRLFATTWSPQPGVWRSPALPLTDGQAWDRVFDVGSYEPDPLTRQTYGIGGVASYGGWLYWGSMHVPLQATKLHQAAYPQDTDDAKRNQIRFTQRATTIWRGKDLGLPTQQIELLYGESALPVYNPSAATWSAVPTGWTPRHGKSGFGNSFNNYTWRMTVAGDRLYVGTMDWSYLVHNVAEQDTTDPAGWGADLWAFPAPGQPAFAVTTTGAGNQLNYGFRNLVADGDDLYAGTANPMNLRAQGGWELLRLERTPAS